MKCFYEDQKDTDGLGFKIPACRHTPKARAEKGFADFHVHSTLQALPLAMPLIAFALPACYVLSDIRLQNVEVA